MANRNVIAIRTHFFTRHGKVDTSTGTPVLDPSGIAYAARLADEVAPNPSQTLAINCDDAAWAVATMQPLADRFDLTIRKYSTAHLFAKAKRMFERQALSKGAPIENETRAWCMRRREGEPDGLWALYRQYIDPILVGEAKQLGPDLSSQEAYNFNWWAFKPFTLRGADASPPQPKYVSYQMVAYQRMTHQGVS